jgi:predicted kinase
MEAAMRADRVELSWDAAKSTWLIRITSGEEVIRRHFQARKDADDKTLLTTAQQEVRDEGYEADPAQVTIKR